MTNARQRKDRRHGTRPHPRSGRPGTGADYIDQTIPADPNAVDSVDVEALAAELDTPWPAPAGDLIEQSIPVHLDDDL